MYNYYHRILQTSPAFIEQQLTLGRLGHFYRVNILGNDEIVQLVSWDPNTQVVGINMNGTYRQFDPNDLTGMSYIGPQIPQPQTPAPPSGGPIPGPGGGIPWTPQLCPPKWPGGNPGIMIPGYGCVYY
ncbi:hypothetical protein [Virgibacillus litoralis]|uniref:Uncharacterized protein n=1 Tax=Virgibacillus litoralis TaxID=578221 RepID=A0ABS4H8U5_9BACI|nr:hypothetical protein [Virgibacillus litoralis]MBP1947164.1 hypothetical protein [Virgibacillus litoralis]